jgi:methylated-DNA-[protein]-cysteine S-methyltransferase
MEHRTHTVVGSPIGSLTLAATDGVLAGLYMEQSRYPPTPDLLGEPDPSAFTETVEQLRAYFDGGLTVFTMPVTLVGTPFQQRVWAALREIPFGETISYLELAQRIGQPTASRAVGLANGRNPISIIVPCHRVVGSSGSLTGYGGGLHRKRHLIDFERRAAGLALDLPVG